MHHYFKSQLKQSILSKYFFLSFFITFILLSYSFLEFITLGWTCFFELSSNHYDFIDIFVLCRSENRASYLVVLAPLLASLVFSHSYLDDKNSGYLNFIYIRIEKKKYVFTKLLVNAIASGLSIITSSVVIILILSAIYGININPEYALNISGPFSDIYISNKYLYLLIILCISFMFNVVFSTLSLGISGIIDNKYISFLSPFFYYIISGSVFYVIGLYKLNSTTLFMPNENVDLLGLMLYQLILFIIGVILFIYGVLYSDEKNNKLLKI